MSEMCDCPPEAGAGNCETHTSLPQVACPTNHQVGKRLDSLTLKGMPAVPLTEIRSTEYFFCPDPNCPTVYYGANGAHLFTESELRASLSKAPARG
jgi:hypothetical protein